MATREVSDIAHAEPEIEKSKNDTTLSAPSLTDGKVDVVAEDIVNAAERHEYSDEQFRKLLRKIDLVLLPIMWACIRSSKIPRTTL